MTAVGLSAHPPCKVIRGGANMSNKMRSIAGSLTVILISSLSLTGCQQILNIIGLTHSADSARNPMEYLPRTAQELQTNTIR